jgi:hypothetical protein
MKNNSVFTKIRYMFRPVRRLSGETVAKIYKGGQQTFVKTVVFVKKDVFGLFWNNRIAITRQNATLEDFTQEPR